MAKWERRDGSKVGKVGEWLGGKGGRFLVLFKGKAAG